MSRVLFDFLDAAHASAGTAELSRVAESAFARLGFDSWAYQGPPPRLLQDGPLLLHNFPKAWEKHYVTEGYAAVDPVITHGANRTAPFQWSSLLRGQLLTPELRTYQQRAADHGLIDGFGIPIRGPRGVSMLSLASQQPRRVMNAQFRRATPDLTAISFAFHVIAQDLSARQDLAADEEPLLNERERECLLWAFKGKTAWETGAIIGLTEAGTVYHLEKARRKLKASSRQHAVIKAVIEGHIRP